MRKFIIICGWLYLIMAAICVATTVHLVALPRIFTFLTNHDSSWTVCLVLALAGITLIVTGWKYKS